MANINLKTINTDIFEIFDGNKKIGIINYNHDSGNYDGFTVEDNYNFEGVKDKKEAINIIVERCCISKN